MIPGNFSHYPASESEYIKSKTTKATIRTTNEVEMTQHMQLLGMYFCVVNNNTK